MILVTGAAGKTGRAVLQALASKGHSVQALVRRPEQARLVESLGAQQVVTGDMRYRAVLDHATRGARAVYHICPNVSPDEVAIGKVALAAARAAGVEHFVYHSVLHPQTESMPHHWLKLRVEELLLESRLPLTILQPAAYMQNILAQWDQILQNGVYQVPYSVETRLTMVDLEDVAAAAALVLSEPIHVGATYELVGTESLAQNAIADTLGSAIGRPVHCDRVPLSQWERRARATGLGDYQVHALLSMFRYYDRHGFHGSPQVLTWLLGRPPSTLEDFVRRQVSS